MAARFLSTGQPAYWERLGPGPVQHLPWLVSGLASHLSRLGLCLPEWQAG
jgi:hypothetical protein